MVGSLYNWLKDNRKINVFLAIIYYLLVVLPHEEVGIWINETLNEPYGIDIYNLIVLWLGGIILLGYIFPLWKDIKQIEEGKGQVLIAFLITFLLIIVAFNTLLVVNIEIIHFVQYAILAILLFPLFNNYQDTLFYAIIFATIDEGYQYFVLAPFRTDYFDFNDIIIDLIGAALGLFLFWINAIKDRVTSHKWFQTPTAIGGFILILIGTIAFLTNILAIYPAESEPQAPLLLIRKIQENFWTISAPNIKFHVVRPFEGLLILGGLFYFYSHRVFNQTLNKLQP